MRRISAEDYLLHASCMLDVRSEVEFEAGHLPDSTNLPLLTTEERHAVGITYKREGQEAAIRLGHKLVDPQRNDRVDGWKQFLNKQAFPVLTCFRGGLRSEIAQRWLAEAGCVTARIEGGYKALRRVLNREWELPLRGFVITGLTGSGKTLFLRRLGTDRAFDLEAMAVHRGSAFGGLFQPGSQPAQQTFENILAMKLHKRKPGDEILLEDESRLVGRCIIPHSFFQSMTGLPRILLECPNAERVENILDEYVRAPLQRREAPQVMGELIVALRTLKKRMGGLTAGEIELAIRRAFQAGNEADAIALHREWVARLLHDYYDPMYAYSMDRRPDKPVFRGNADACADWLRTHSATSV